MTHPPRRQGLAGIFLVELLIGLLLIAILVTVAMPGFQVLLRSYRVRVVAEDLMSELTWAREEAIRRGAVVTLRLKPAADCPAEFAASAQRCGWEVLIDNGTSPLQVPAQVLRSYQMPGGVTLSDAVYENSRFDASGNPRDRGGRFVVSSMGAVRDDPATRVLCIGFGGRVRMGPGVTCQP